MNKFGHITITRHLTQDLELKRRHRFCLTFGSILPDLLFYTFAGGHTRSSTEEMVYGKMCALETEGKSDCRSYLRLGYILHYVEDFFTYPHNDWYPHGAKAHFTYEHRLSLYAFRRRLQPLPAVPCLPPAELPPYLIRLHGHYEEGEPCIARDYRYILRAGSALVGSYVRNWTVSERLTRPITPQAIFMPESPEG